MNRGFDKPLEQEFLAILAFDLLAEFIAARPGGSAVLAIDHCLVVGTSGLELLNLNDCGEPLAIRVSMYQEKSADPACEVKASASKPQGIEFLKQVRDSQDHSFRNPGVYICPSKAPINLCKYVCGTDRSKRTSMVN